MRSAGCADWAGYAGLTFNKTFLLFFFHCPARYPFVRVRPLRAIVLQCGNITSLCWEQSPLGLASRHMCGTWCHELSARGVHITSSIKRPSHFHISEYELIFNTNILCLFRVAQIMKFDNRAHVFTESYNFYYSTWLTTSAR